MSDYLLFVLFLGLATLGAGWLPSLLKGRPLSLAMCCLALGYAVSWLPWGWPGPDVIRHGRWIEHISELGVLISLAGAGLSLDRELTWRGWLLPRRLLLLAMPLTILLATATGHLLLGLPLAGALLLGAVLSPTDPVLASDVQVKGPNEDHEHKLRFALTAEAGLNDGLAFPFTALAIAVVQYGSQPDLAWLWEWFGFDLVYRIVAGIGVGAACGYGVAKITFDYITPKTLEHTTVALVVVGFTLFVFGATELLHGYGFLGVFVAAVVVRRYHKRHKYHEEAHDLATQLEHIFLVFFLFFFGMQLGQGALSELDWRGGVFVALLLLVWRPLAGWLSLLRQDQASARERFALSFLGIRGIGSIYYLAYAFNHAYFERERYMWAIVGATITGSIFLHGALASPLIDRCEQGCDEE